jgi:hypothetical protein
MRPVHALRVEHIGKEANLLDQAAAQLIGETDRLIIYADPDQDLFDNLVRPVLREMNVRLTAAAAGISPSTLTRIRAGATPHPGNREILTRLAVEHARARLTELGFAVPRDGLAVLLLYGNERRKL